MTTMPIKDLVEKCTHVSITVEASALEHFADYLIDKTKKEMEDVVMRDKAESYPTVKQVSEMLNVDLTTLWRWNKKGYLKTIEFGGGRRYKMSEVKALMNRGKS